MLDASDTTAHLIRDNWQRVQAEVAEACLAADRRPDEVRIVGVSKYVGASLAMQLVAAGCQLLGENRPQALWEKFQSFLPESQLNPEWHFIGHMQRNKLRRSLPMMTLLHSLDSLRLAETVSQEALAIDTVLPVLVEVNVTRDTAKTGLPASELRPFLEHVHGLPGLEVRGLMAMASLDSRPEDARREFDCVRELRDDMQRELGDRFDLGQLSMGMSGDFPQAIAAGATLVRIGTKLWEGVL
jgi:pyridoxal phosphate enzyme (YggS family)